MKDKPIQYRTLSRMLDNDHAEIISILKKVSLQLESFSQEFFPNDNSDIEINYRETAHKIKSSASLVGAEKLSDLCKKLEITEESDQDAINNQVSTIIEEINSIKKYVDTL